MAGVSLTGVVTLGFLLNKKDKELDLDLDFLSSCLSNLEELKIMFVGDDGSISICCLALDCTDMETAAGGGGGPFCEAAGGGGGAAKEGAGGNKEDKKDEGGVKIVCKKESL